MAMACLQSQRSTCTRLGRLIHYAGANQDPHRMLTGIEGFDRSQHHGRQSRESIRPPFRLRQREEYRYGWDEATGHKGKANLNPLHK